MDIEGIEQSASIYARFIGIVEFLCPQCGTMLRQQTTPRGPWVTACTRAGCEKRWAFGVALHEVPQGFKLPPLDTMFPSASKMLKLWRSGEPVNDLAR